jgi:hypothetical protein
MYALIYKNKVICGPKAWSQPYFTYVLQKQGVEKFAIPRKEQSSIPHVISEDAKICAVREIKPDINPLIQYHRGPLWSMDNDVAVATYEVYYSPLESSKTAFKQLAATERFKKESEGIVVTIQGADVTVYTDRDNRRIYLETYLTMEDQETVQWKFPETWLTISKEELQSIIKQGAEHIQGVFNWEKGIVDQIDECTEHSQLLQITITEEVQSDVT